MKSFTLNRNNLKIGLLLNAFLLTKMQQKWSLYQQRKTDNPISFSSLPMTLGMETWDTFPEPTDQR